jgi:peptide/nickel transport system permease protein
MAPADAARCVTLWKEWWLTTHSDFELLSGPDRVFAILTDTQYGKWVLQVLTLELGVGSDGVTVLERLRFRSPITVNTALLSLLLAYSFAFPLSLMGALKKNKAQDRLTTIILVILLAIPAPIIAVFAARMGSLWPLTFSTLIIVASLITSPARHQRLLAIAELSKDWSCFAHARGIHPMRILLVHVGNPVVALALTLAAIDFPLAMSVVCVTEYALGTEGLGSCLVRAVLERDVAFLMAFGLASTVLHTLLLFASDLLVERLDPRLGRIHRGERAWQ